MPSQDKDADLEKRLSDNLVQLARLGLAGRSQDVQAYLRQTVRRLRQKSPDLATQLSELLVSAPSASSPLRDFGSAMVPVDADSRLALLKTEYPVVAAEAPILAEDLSLHLEQVIAEQDRLNLLEQQGLGPTRSLLFVGPPGVGKTMSARWLASRLDRPLLTLDLATVMSSYLGKTGTNIRSVLDYAKNTRSVLLLDEFDAIAKKRDDEGDVGELKRLVTVLLQEIDDWPTSSLLIAATNHGELLDPAVWRRFDEVLEFRAPSASERRAQLWSLFAPDSPSLEVWLPILADIWEGRSYSDLARMTRWIRRRATVSDEPLLNVLLQRIGSDLRAAASDDRKRVAQAMSDAGFSDRRISEVVGISRDTIRKGRTSAAGAKGRDS